MNHRKTESHPTVVLLGFLLIFACAGVVRAQTTSFTYQGRLTDGGTPATGTYDLQFALWDSNSGGTQIGATQTVSAVAVSGGIFTVTLDFGVSAFPGADRFLEIGVRPAGAGTFTILSPRQQISSTPYAIRTLSAASADSATTALTATNATQLGGVAASQYVQTSDSRLTDSRPPTAGSANYIQNTTSPQSSSNFNISGNGTAGGTLNGNVVNATTQYNINGNRMLSAPGTNNLFAGVGSGQANTSGNSNVFVGPGAGQANTIGARNSFFGLNAGHNNVGDAFGNGSDNSFFGNGAGTSNTGQQNSFFGVGAGAANTAGNFNTFIGEASGLNNTTGGFNTFIGSNTGFSGPGPSNTSGSNNTAIGLGAKIGLDIVGSNLTNASAIGANAFVGRNNSLVLGSISGVNGATTDTKVGIGISYPLYTLDVSSSDSAGTASFGNQGSGPGVSAFSATGRAVEGITVGGALAPSGVTMGVYGSAPNYGVYGQSNSGYAGYFDGKIHVASVPFGSGTPVLVTPGGDIVAQGSSLRFKTNVHPFVGGLEIVRRLRPINFNWKQDGQPDIGLGAEDVAKVAPSFTFTDSKGEVSGVKYPQLSALFINAFKEQQNQIEALRKQNAALNARLRGVEMALRKNVGLAARRR